MAEEYFVDPESGEVSQGKQRSWLKRMGPYPSREAAAHAFEKVRERNEDWDEQDRDWDDEQAD